MTEIEKLRFDLDEMYCKFDELASQYESLYNNLEVLVDDDPLPLDPEAIKSLLFYSKMKVQEIGVMHGR